LSRPRAVVLVTGSELVRGDRTDRNGPFLARELLSLGLEPARIVVVGDSAEELEPAFREALEADLCVVSGGLGPTHDDRTVEVLARVAGRELVVDKALEGEIERVSRSVAERLRRPYADFAAGVRKQATLPAGAIPIGLAGTAPGLVLENASSAVVVLPGPPPELRRLWPAALETAPLRALLARARPPVRRVLRFYGASESTVAQAFADVGGEEGVETTICAREFEIHVDLVADRGAEERAAALASALRERLDRYFFADDERPVEELLLELCRERGLSLGTAESCTGGLVAARLTSVPGSSDVFRGSIVAYDNAVKRDELGVGEGLLERHGAVSAEVAEAMAEGVRARLGVDLGVSDTGIAGPGGGTAKKPVGLVYVHVAGADGGLARKLDFPGDRQTIRTRAAVAALHLCRRFLTQNRDSTA
jgi:nicotinamide-nucleotide amidase